MVVVEDEADPELLLSLSLLLLLLSLLRFDRLGESDERPAVNRWMVSSICCNNSLGSSPWTITSM